MKTEQLLTVGAIGVVGFVAWRWYAANNAPPPAPSPQGYSIALSPATLTNAAPTFSAAQFVSPVGFSSGSSSASNPGSTVIFNFGANPTVPASAPPAAAMPGTGGGTPYSADGATGGCSCSGTTTQAYGSKAAQALALASIIDKVHSLGPGQGSGMAYDYGPNSEAERQLATERQALDAAFTYTLLNK